MHITVKQDSNEDARDIIKKCAKFAACPFFLPIKEHGPSVGWMLSVCPNRNRGPELGRWSNLLALCQPATDCSVQTNFH